MILRREAVEQREVFENFDKGLTVFPRFGGEILAWLDGLEVED